MLSPPRTASEGVELDGLTRTRSFALAKSQSAEASDPFKANTSGGRSPGERLGATSVKHRARQESSSRESTVSHCSPSPAISPKRIQERAPWIKGERWGEAARAEPKSLEANASAAADRPRASSRKMVRSGAWIAKVGGVCPRESCAAPDKTRRRSGPAILLTNLIDRYLIALAPPEQADLSYGMSPPHDPIERRNLLRLPKQGECMPRPAYHDRERTLQET